MQLETTARQIEEILELLANKNRLMILYALEQRGALTAREIAEAVPPISQPALSQHLSVLRIRKIIDVAPKGRDGAYRICNDKVAAIMDMLRQQFCVH